MISIGQTLNNTYEIIEQLGSGGGGIVYKAYHKRMQKYVAIKLIKDEIKGDINIRSEVDSLKNLKNDFLPQMLDFIEDGEDVYTVMEFIEGMNFKQIIEGGRTFDERSVIKYAIQLCSAVHYLHSQDPPVIHSDIKPANIMLTPSENICLIDFNISVLSDKGSPAAIGGSRNFAAPEQFRRIIKAPVFIDEFHEITRFIGSDETEILLDSEHESHQTSNMKTKNSALAYIDARTDIYGIGSTIYYLLTERVPANGHIDFRGIHCSQHIKNIITKAMKPNPNNRFQNVLDMRKALTDKSYKTKKYIRITTAFLVTVLLCIGGYFSVNRFDVSFEEFQSESEAKSEVLSMPVTTIQINETEKNVPDQFEITEIVESNESSIIRIIDDETIKHTVSDDNIISQNTETITTTVPSKTIVSETTYMSEDTSQTTSAIKEEVEVVVTSISIKGKQYPTSLTELSLSEMDLNNNDITDLKYMTNLTKLEIDRNNITDINVLTYLTNLQELKLTDSKIKDFSPVKELRKLKVFKAGMNNLSDISFLSDLTELTELKLGVNNISDISPLKKLTKLEFLDLRANKVSDISVLAELPNLSEVLLFKNSLTSINTLKKQNSLTKIWIDKYQLDNISAISHYENAEILIYNDNVEESVLSEVQSALPNCKVKVFNDPWADVYGY